MPRYALIEDGVAREVAGAFTAVVPIAQVVLGHPIPWPQEQQFPPGWLEASTADERTALGIHEIVDGAPPPAGKCVATRTLEVIDGQPTEVLTYQDLAPEPEFVPQRVSRMQAKLALHTGGLLDDVEAAVAAAPREVQIYWAEVSELHRDHAILNQMTEALGWTSEQVDDLFRAAAAIF